MTVIQPIEKNLDLDHIYEMILQTIETEDFTQALALSQKGKQIAQSNSLEEWANQFEELRLQIEVALHVDDLDDEFNGDEVMKVIHDFTVLNGIGPSAAQKLTNAGFSSIQQLALSEPQEVASIKGFGLTTAAKLIEDAKSYLRTHNSRKDEEREIWKPTSSLQKDFKPKEDSVITFTSKTSVTEELTPYQKLLNREPSEFDSEQDTTEMETVKEEVIEDLDELEEEDDNDLPNNSNKQSPWFDTRYQYSRLTGVHPPRSKANFQDIDPVEPPLMYEDFEEPEEQSEIKNTTGTMEPSSSIANDYSDIDTNTDKNNIEPILPEFVEPKKMPSSYPKVIKKTVTSSLTQTKPVLQINLVKELERDLKKQGYRLILNHKFHSINYLAYRIIPIDGNIKLFLLLPIQIEDHEEMLIVSENMVSSQFHPGSEIHSVQELIVCRDVIYDDIILQGSFFQFLNRYLKLQLTVEKSVEQKRLYLTSGQEQYKIFIEPILFTKDPPHFMEKVIPFAYQRNSNLHVAHYEDLPDLLEFLESKYEILETLVHEKTALQQYQDASGSFNRKLRLTSFLTLGYTFLLFIMFITNWFYLLRIFLNIGYAVIGIYTLTMVYIYYHFYLAKKNLAVQFNTPYYQKEVHLDEADLLVLKEEYSHEILVQFGYECLGKSASYIILENFECYSTDNSRGEFQKEIADLSQQEKHNSNDCDLLNKYSSFLED